MNLLNKLTKKNLVLNKKRTIVTIVGIILSVALITALSSLVISFKKSALEYEKKRSGDYHVSFSHVLSNDISKLKENRYIEDVYFSKEVGYAKLDGIKNEDKPFVYLLAYDFKSLDKIVKQNVLEGRLPKTSKEIVISKHLKTNGRVDLNIGDTIKLDIGKRLIKGEDSILDQTNPYNAELETFKSDEEHEYKIVGIIERPSYSIEPYTAPGYTFITCLDEMNGSMYNAYVRYKHEYLSDPYYVTADILGIDKKIYKTFMTGGNFNSEEEMIEFNKKYQEEMEKARYEVINLNNYLVSLEYQNLKDPSMQALYTVAAIVTLIIMATSIYCIKNSFDISITEKVRQYGMLASIGATKRQIRRNVLYEAFILGLIAIPIGILSGLFASFVLVKITSILLGDALNIELNFGASIGSILLSVALGAVTIYLSAIKSARKASKISPIAAIRNSNDIKIKSKKIKSPKLIKKLFGIGGDVSYKNLKRNSKKYRTTVISIVVCVSVFIALYSFMMLAFKAVDLSYKDTDFNIDITFKSNDDKKDTIIKKIVNIEGIKDYSVNVSRSFILDTPKFSPAYDNYYKKNYEISNGKIENFGITFISLGDYQYRKYIQSLGLKYEDVYDGAILLNKQLVYEYDEKAKKGKTHDLDIFDYKRGDILKGHMYDYNCESTDGDEDKCWFDTSVKVSFLTDKQPFGQASNFSDNAVMVVSDEFMKKYSKVRDYYELLLDVKNPDKFQDEAEKILEEASDYNLYNVDKEKKSSESLFTLIAIFLYGFITVIALIGITNIFNTITTSVELRAREFATLKSVGMTKREFNKMVSLESIFYGLKSLIIGIPIGSILSYIIYKALIDGDLEFAYTYPTKAVIISIFAVLILVTVIMKYSISKINKQNTIETIRNDNI